MLKVGFAYSVEMHSSMMVKSICLVILQSSIFFVAYEGYNQAPNHLKLSASSYDYYMAYDFILKDKGYGECMR